MNRQDQAIDELVQQLYQMARTLVAQQHTINELRSRLASGQRQYTGIF